MQFGNTVGPFFDRIVAQPDCFDFVELSVGQRNVPVSDVDVDAVTADCDAAGVDVVLHLPLELPIVTAVPEVQAATHDYLDRSLDLAAALGAEKAVAHCDATRGSRDPERFTESVERIHAAGAERGVPVAFENLGMLDRGFDLSTVGETLADAGAAMCFDVGHAFQEGGQDAVDEFLASHADLVSHLHVHDARSRGDSHLTVGAGEIDYDSVATGLSAVGFDGTVATEVFAPDQRLCEHSMRVVREKFEAAD